jgi:hypothetical protein
MSTEAIIERAIANAAADGVIDAGGDEGIESPEETTEVVESDPNEEGTGEVEETTEEPTEEGEEEVEGEEETEEEPEVEEEAVEEEDPLGIGPSKDKNGRENKIPHSRVKVMVTKNVQKAVGQVTGVVAKAFGIPEAQVTQETLTNALAQIPVMRERLSTFEDVEPIMRQDGDTFIKMLAEANPEQYGKFLAVLEDGYDANAAKTAIAKDEPQPDVPITLQDGTKGVTYSLEQLKKRDDWREAQLMNKIEKQFEAKFGKRIKPFEDARSAQQKETDTRNELAGRIKDLLDEARADWDGFQENEQAIREAYGKIPNTVPMGRRLRQAWQGVVLAKYKGSKSKVRQATMKELKDAPVSTSAKGKVVKKVEVVRNEDGEAVTGTEAAIRRSIARANAAGLK